MLYIARNSSIIFPKLVLAGTLMFSSLGASHSQELEFFRAKIENSDSNDIVLHQMQFGVAAMNAGEYKLAKEAFEFVLTDIESLFSNTEDSMNARSVWWKEGKKSFKGEPYERSMAYYYIGLLYFMEEDFDNARASFVAGQLQDSFAEEDQDKSDFVALMLSEYWAATLAGSEGLADAALADVQLLRPELGIPNPMTHTLVLVETGASPRKLNDGVSGERLVFRRGKNFEEKFAFATLGDINNSWNLMPLEDVYYQASTRGARAIDGINEGKASFKGTWNSAFSTVANLSNQVTLYTNLGRDFSDLYSYNEVGASLSGANFRIATNSRNLAAAASVFSLIGASFRASADVRYWSNLPDTIHVGFIPNLELNNEIIPQITMTSGSRADLYSVEVQPFNRGEASALIWFKTK